jgi:hypothetical protein
MAQLQRTAVLESSTISFNSGSEFSSSTPGNTRTTTESGKCDHTNLIPDTYKLETQTIQIVNNIECYVSNILSDPLYKIHTITESESED